MARLNHYVTNDDHQGYKKKILLNWSEEGIN
jgi:hypothetical protein